MICRGDLPRLTTTHETPTVVKPGPISLTMPLGATHRVRGPRKTLQRTTLPVVPAHSGRTSAAGRHTRGSPIAFAQVTGLRGAREPGLA